LPLFIHIASASQAARVAKLAVDPRKFYPGMPSAAYDVPGFSSSNYWRGPAWLNTSYFALKGLKDYGYDDSAEAMRSTLLNWVALDPTDMREYYDSNNGGGLGAKRFGWSAAFVISFIEDWSNDNLTFLFPHA
jgi:putative isomerase